MPIPRLLYLPYPSIVRLNYQKSSVMWFRPNGCVSKCLYPDIIVDNTVLQVTEKQTYLGLVFDCNLSWCHHVANICKKMSYYLYLISSHRHVLSFQLLKMLSESLVLSHLTYCIAVWGPSLTHAYLLHLQHMQNRAVRLCVI